MDLTKNTVHKNFESLIQGIVHWLETHSLLALGMLTVLGLLISMSAFSSHSFLSKPASDSPWTIGSHLYEGQGYTACSTSYFPFCGPNNNVTAEREPIPVFMFLGAMEIDPSYLAGFILEILLYLGVLYALYFTLRDESRILALGAGFLWVVSIVVMKEIGNADGNLEAAFWIVPAFFFFQKARTTHRNWHWAVAGLFFGLAALSRTVIFAVAIGLGVALLFESALGGLKSRFQQMIVFLVTFALVLSPWVIRNEISLGSPVFGSTLAGYNVYRYNYILAKPDYYPHYVGAQEARLAVKDLVQNSTLRGTENEAQMEAFYLHKGLQIISTHSIRYAGLVAFRFLVLWFDDTVKASYGQTTDMLDIVEVLEQLVLLAAVIAGALLFPRKYWPYTLTILITAAAYMAVGAQERYLVEIMPGIVTLASTALFSWTKAVVPQ